ncbi:MAG: PIG-L deacetylase family protein [Armatimonadota bacterium]
MKVLVLAGHLDDSILAVGGIISKVAKSGGTVDVVCFGHSDEDYDDISNKDAAVTRLVSEAERAHDVLGVNSFTCLHYPDYAVQENRETYRLCIESIRKYQPDIILSHYWAEYFQHRAMARLACDSWWQAGWACSADIGKPWTARALYHFEVIHPLPEPTDIVDVSDTFDLKIKALQCFQSGYSFTEQVECRARYLGSTIGVRYAEALRKSSFMPRAVLSVEEL